MDPLSQEPTPQSKSGAKPFLWVSLGCGGCLIVAVLGIVALFGVVFGAMTSSKAYEQAMDAASNDPRVQEALGTPVEAGMFVTGSINLSGSSGDADLTIPISGPKGEGTVYVIGTKRAGEWTFTTLEADVGGERVDLQQSPEGEEDEEEDR